MGANFGITTVLQSASLFTLPPNSYVEILRPNVIVLGGVDLGRCLGHEGGALTNRISVLIKETPQIS